MEIIMRKKTGQKKDNVIKLIIVWYSRRIRRDWRVSKEEKEKQSKKKKIKWINKKIIRKRTW